MAAVGVPETSLEKRRHDVLILNHFVWFLRGPTMPIQSVIQEKKKKKNGWVGGLEKRRGEKEAGGVP